MSIWQRKLNIADFWNGYKKGDNSIQDLARVIADRLKRLSAFNIEDIDEDKECLVDEFFTLSEDQTATDYDLDGLMEQLYDWGDTKLDNKRPPKKVCWM